MRYGEPDVTNLRRSTRALLFLGSWLAACGLGESDAEVPACEGASLFQDEACITGVMERCRAIGDEAGCRAATRIQTDDFEVMCGWTQVTPLVDADTCEMGASFGRCEAGIEYSDGAAAFGTCDDQGEIPEGISVFLEAREFVQIVSTPGEPTIGGILGPWALVGAAPGDHAVCGEQWSPPGPGWCDCATAVCAGE